MLPVVLPSLVAALAALALQVLLVEELLLVAPASLVQLVVALASLVQLARLLLEVEQVVLAFLGQQVVAFAFVLAFALEHPALLVQVEVVLPFALVPS